MPSSPEALKRGVASPMETRLPLPKMSSTFSRASTSSNTSCATGMGAGMKATATLEMVRRFLTFNIVERHKASTTSVNVEER